MSRASGRGRKDNWKLNGYYGKIGEAQKIQQEVIYHEYSRDKRHDNRESCPFTAGIFHAADAGEPKGNRRKHLQRRHHSDHAALRPDDSRSAHADRLIISAACGFFSSVFGQF